MAKLIEETIKENYPEFFETCLTIKSEDIDVRLAQLAKDAEAVAQAQDEDEELHDTKEKAAQLGAPYREAKKAIKLKSRYLVKIQKERGGA